MPIFLFPFSNFAFITHKPRILLNLKFNYFYMKKLSLISLCLLLLLSLGCGGKVTKKAMKRGEALKSSLNSFENNRQKLSKNVVESLEEAEAALTSDSPNLTKISKDWEKEWNGVQSRYNKLRNDFERVGKNSEDYFQQLNDLSRGINDENLRKQELDKNKELKQRWLKTYQEAAVSITKVTEVLKSGNDFHRVLVASSIRQKLEQNVDELKLIAQQAKALLGDLEAFTEAGRELVEG